tara:strand:+ start:404 stop:592 length:189 start_codon:yes stop_codon:yes gene_type:complete
MTSRNKGRPKIKGGGIGKNYTNLVVPIDPKIKEALANEAAESFRPVTQLVRMILTERYEGES